MSLPTRQLPRGRHGLSRQEVRSSQRDRILRAIAHAVAEKGFASTTVADVIARAGVSRETFYEQFGDKLDCFLAALDAAAQTLIDVLQRAAAGARGDALERVLDAYLGALAADPMFAKAFLIDAYGAGPEATSRRLELQQRFVELIAGASGASSGSQHFACEAVVAAISSMATARIGTGRADALAELRDPLMALAEVVLPR